MTERRKKQFAAQSKADQNYNQKATDSLLNFETVKYFNAEAHEEHRFETALRDYKEKVIKVAKDLVMLNISQSIVISCGICGSLCLANYFFE